MISPPTPNDFQNRKFQKWNTCIVCGDITRKAVLVFKSMSTIPVVGETLTGATSTNTGVVDGVKQTGATVGYVILSSPTGYDTEKMDLFSDGENINGSVGGASIIQADGVGSVITTGKMYPEESMVFYKGSFYCQEHFIWKFRNVFKDEARIDLREEDRNSW